MNFLLFDFFSVIVQYRSNDTVHDYQGVVLLTKETNKHLSPEEKKLKVRSAVYIEIGTMHKRDRAHKDAHRGISIVSVEIQELKQVLPVE